MIATSTALPASASATRSRLATVSASSTPGWRSRKRASSRGAKYFAVLATAIATRPRSIPFSPSSDSSASSTARSIARAWSSTIAPAAVSASFRRTRSNSGRPALASRSFSCIETAGCDRCSSSAARAKDRWRAAASKTRNCLSVAWRSGTVVLAAGPVDTST